MLVLSRCIGERTRVGPIAAVTGLALGIDEPRYDLRDGRDFNVSGT